MEVQLQVPAIRAFDRDVLLLVVPNIPYGDTVPLQFGAVQIDMMLDVATKDELQALGMSWLQGELATRLAGGQNEGVDNSFNLDSVQGDVKLIKECHTSTNGNKTSNLYH